MALTKAAIDALLADNTAGDISAADMRDVVHSGHLSPGGERTRVPVDVTQFAWVNQGTATATQYGDTVSLRCPNVGGLNLRGMFRSITAPVTITARFRMISIGTDWYAGGLAVRQAGTGEIVYFGRVAAAITVSHWASPTSHTGTVFTNASFEPIEWLRIVDDNTNRSYHISPDGHEWSQLYTEVRTTHLTADQAGFIANEYSGAAGSHKVLAVQSWEQ